jgi:hypothetical protein
MRRKGEGRRSFFCLEIGCLAIFCIAYSQTYFYFKAREKGLEAQVEALRSPAAEAAVTASAKATPLVALATSFPVQYPSSHHATNLEQSLAHLEGVAVVCCLDGPGWIQKRYSMSVQNMVNALPASWRVQLFHHGSEQSTKGLALSFGLRRLLASGKILLTEVGGPWKKRSRSEIYLSKSFWQTVKAENVLFFGHGGVQCQNSPLTISNFTQYDLASSPDGGFV